MSLFLFVIDVLLKMASTMRLRARQFCRKLILSRAIAWSAIIRFSLEEDQIPAAANSRASAFKQCRSFHLSAAASIWSPSRLTLPAVTGYMRLPCHP